MALSMNALALSHENHKHCRNGLKRLLDALGKEPYEVLLLVVLHIEDHVLEIIWEPRAN